MKKSNTSIQVIERSAQLLDSIARYDTPVSLKILSAETGLHPSTAFRILGALTEVGLVERDSRSRYLLGRKLARLGGRVRQGTDLRQEAIDIMEKLRDDIGETVNLTVREGDEVIYIDRVSPRRMMRVEQVIGSRAPLHVTAVGKLMLAHLGDDFIRAYSRRTGLPAYTSHTLSHPEHLLDTTHTLLQQGYAFDNEEAEDGVGCIGTLIYDGSGAVVAGLSISAPMERRRDAWIPLLLQAGQQISQRLGHRAA